jgi:hypothetical protein
MTSNWERRLNKMENEIRDYWQNLQYTVEDALEDNMDKDEYINMVAEDYFATYGVCFYMREIATERLAYMINQ